MSQMSGQAMDSLLTVVSSTMSPETLSQIQESLYWILVFGFIIAIFLYDMKCDTFWILEFGLNVEFLNWGGTGVLE